MATQVAEGFRFGEYELDRVSFELRRTGVPCPVEPQVFDGLAYLLRHHAVVVSKEELLDNVWGDRFLSQPDAESRRACVPWTRASRNL